MTAAQKPLLGVDARPIAWPPCGLGGSATADRTAVGSKPSDHGIRNPVTQFCCILEIPCPEIDIDDPRVPISRRGTPGHARMESGIEEGGYWRSIDASQFDRDRPVAVRPALMKAEPVNRLSDSPVRIRMPERGAKPWVALRKLISPGREAVAVIAEEGLKWATANRPQVPLIFGKFEKLEHEPRSAKGIQIRLHELEDLPLNVYVVAVGHGVVVRIRTEVQPLVREPSLSKGLINSFVDPVDAFSAQVAPLASEQSWPAGVRTIRSNMASERARESGG